MTSMDKTPRHHHLVGYALIAFALAFGHAYAQGVNWTSPAEPDFSPVAVTSVSAPESIHRSDSSGGVELDGMASAGGGLEQPLMIHNTECGSYAVSREMSYSFSHAQSPLEI